MMYEEDQLIPNLYRYLQPWEFSSRLVGVLDEEERGECSESAPHS
jgi:hypothetical protein